MKLRVRSSRGVSDLQVDPQSTFGSLKAQLGASSLRSGFPPKPLAADDEQPVSAVLSHGDVLVVQSNTSSAPSESKRSPSIASDPCMPSTAVKSSIPSTSILSNGTLVIRQVPDDNSCLFRSVNALLGRAAQPPVSLRTIVRDAVAAQPALYGEAFLGRSNSEYQLWIMNENSWGGAIELSILAKHFKLELAAFDVKTMRLDRYGEGNGYRTVGFLLYDGIHYNYVALALGDASSSLELDVTQFQVQESMVVDHVRRVAQAQHNARKYTDTANARFKCGQCGAVFKGEQQVALHAKQSGHSQFSES
ncbi:unnamed protein product [Agarophyton chilense]